MQSFYSQGNLPDALERPKNWNGDVAPDPVVDTGPALVLLNPSIHLPTRPPRPRASQGPSRANSSKTRSRRRSELDPDPSANFQRLAFVTVLDPAQLKDRANRKIEHVHSKREYFRRKRLKSLQEAREEANVPSKPKEIAINITSHPQIHAPQTHLPSKTCANSDRPFCSQCRKNPESAGEDDTVSQSPSSYGSPPDIYHADLVDNKTPSFALSLHHQTNILNSGSIDPFGTFPVQSNPEIGLLMDSFVSNFSDGSLLTVNGPKLPTNFAVIFQLALTDSSLFNSLLFLGSGASRYHAEAIRLLNQKLKQPNSATDNASMIAILIWSDLSISGGSDRPKHDSHMRGLKKLLQMRNQTRELQESISERGLMERGLLWADLAGASLMGAPRFFAHDAFSTVNLALPAPKDMVSVPHGFEMNAGILGFELLEVIQEICDFRTEIESQNRVGLTFEELSALDNRKASIEWRLTSMQDRDLNDPMKECCRLALHVCSSAIFPPFFGPSKMPISLSQRLSQSLSRSDLDSCWNQKIDLLLWVIFIGASRTRSQADLPVYTKALRLILSQFGSLCETWEQTVFILETFIWSEKVFGDSCRLLWNQTSPFGHAA